MSCVYMYQTQILFYSIDPFHYFIPYGVWLTRLLVIYLCTVQYLYLGTIDMVFLLTAPWRSICITYFED